MNKAPKSLKIKLLNELSSVLCTSGCLIIHLCSADVEQNETDRKSKLKNPKEHLSPPFRRLSDKAKISNCAIMIQPVHGSHGACVIDKLCTW